MLLDNFCPFKLKQRQDNRARGGGGAGGAASAHGDFKQDSSGNLVSIRRGYKAVHVIVNRPVLILN